MKAYDFDHFIRLSIRKPKSSWCAYAIYVYGTFLEVRRILVHAPCVINPSCACRCCCCHRLNSSPQKLSWFYLPHLWFALPWWHPQSLEILLRLRRHGTRNRNSFCKLESTANMSCRQSISTWMQPMPRQAARHSWTKEKIIVSVHV